jgi:TolB-like protein
VGSLRTLHPKIEFGVQPDISETLQRDASATFRHSEIEVGEDSSRSWGRLAFSRLVVPFAVLFAAGGFLSFGPILIVPVSTNQRVRSIAVLPMENLSGDPTQDGFVDGMTEELITDLAKVSSVRVISRTSVMRYKGTKQGLPEIARELKVDAVVEGSVLRSGKRVRITAQLLHAPTDRHLWAESYERDAGDELSLRKEVAQAIEQQVQAHLETQKPVLSPLSARNSGSRLWPVRPSFELRNAGGGNRRINLSGRRDIDGLSTIHM